MRKQITGNEEIKLYSWMAQEGLKGNALVVYAIVYDAGVLWRLQVFSRFYRDGD